MNRRGLFRFGRLNLLGLIPALADWIVKAKPCIVLFQVGRPFHCDPFDPQSLAYA